MGELSDWLSRPMEASSRGAHGHALNTAPARRDLPIRGVPVRGVPVEDGIHFLLGDQAIESP